METDASVSDPTYYYGHQDANFTLVQAPGFNYTDCAQWQAAGATSYIVNHQHVAYVLDPFPYDVYVEGVNNCRTHGIDRYKGVQIFWRDIIGRNLITGKNLGPPCTACGNPINPGTGNKYQLATDYISPVGPLQFARHYNSQSTPLSKLGNNWRHTYYRNLSTKSTSTKQFAYVFRQDGKSVVFQLVGADWTPDADVTDRLTRLTDGVGALTGWRFYVGATEDTENYDAQGQLVSIISRSGVTQTLAYASGNVASVTDSFGRSLSFAYDAAGRMQAMTDPAGGMFYYAYDAANNLSTVIDPANYVRTYLYEGNPIGPYGQPYALTGIMDENNSRFATYGYDVHSGMAISTEHAGGVEKYQVNYATTPTQIIDPLMTVKNVAFDIWQGIAKNTTTTQPCVSACTTMTQTRDYDVNGNSAQTIDFNGNVTKYNSYDLVRNLELSRTEAFGTALTRTITTTWHPTYRLPATITGPTSAGSMVTTFSYDLSGNVIGKSVTVAGVTRSSSWTYDSFGRVLTATDPRNNTTTNVYYPNDPSQVNKRGMLNTATNAAGHVTTITSYNAFGQPLSITDPNGLVTAMGYDARQRLTSRNVGGETTIYVYDGVGQLTRVTTPDGSYLSYTYDGAHRPVQIQDGVGNRVVYSLDNSGNRIKEDYIDPLNALARSRSRVYDALNRLQKDIGGATPASQITQYGYDGNGNLNTSTDPLNRVTMQTYDALNRLLQVIDPVNGSAAATKYEYDIQDNLTKVTDPKALATTYFYNGFNELTSQSSPDTGITGFTYDTAGNMLSKTDARGIVSTYSYDALNRVATIAYPAYGGDAAETVIYTYDGCTNGKGRLCSLTDKTGTTSYSYNMLGRVAAKSQTVAGLTQSLGYGYNGAGQLTAVTYPSGAAIGYGYLNNRIASVALNGVTVLSNADYEPFGPVGEWLWGNSTSLAPNKHIRYFDLDGRNTMIESIAGLDPSLIVYDAASRITDLQKLTANVVDPAKSTSYGYDNLDRLTTASPNAGNPNPLQGFSYDGVGNRLSATVASGVTTYGYGATSHRLTSLTGANPNTYTYDAAGNRATGTAATWTYGANNRPVQASTGAITTSYLINALGQRVSKVTSGIGTRFMYDEGGHLIGEYNVSGNRISETVWFNDLPVAVMK